MEIGHYQVRQPRCEDALGRLFEGFDRRDQRKVFIFLPQLLEGSTPGAVLAQLQGVAQVLAAPAISGLLPITECGIHDGKMPYLIMPYAECIFLDAVLEKEKSRVLQDALHIGSVVARVLLAAHKRGQLHLALSPSQILLHANTAPGSQPIVSVRGVGIAQVTGVHCADLRQPGEKPYAAPEQFGAERGAAVHAHSDVYSLAVLLCEMLSGRSPQPHLTGEQDVKARQTPLRKLYQDVALPGNLGVLLLRMLSVVPADRPGLDEVSRALDAALAEQEASHRVPFPSGDKTPVEAALVSTLPPPSLSSLLSDPTPTPIMTAASLSIDAHIGTLFGSYRVVRKLGEGGMGVVYETEHVKIGRRAAVKILHPQFAGEAGFGQRFLNEARAVNVVRHRGLVEIFDYGQQPDGTLYYVMEYLEGSSLRRRIDERNGPFPDADVVAVGVQLARGLDAAHRAGIVHRDLKPENIMLEADPVTKDKDWVKILDFGIAKFRPHLIQSAGPVPPQAGTNAGASMGTPRYMAPEQHGQAEDADGRADVFALGLILYEMLTGQFPFKSNALELLSRTLPTVRQLRPAVSTRLSKLIARMLAAHRDQRPAMDEVARQLAALMPRAGVGRKRLASAAAVIGLFVGALLVTLLNSERVQTPAELRNHALSELSAGLAAKDPNVQLMAVRAIGQSRDFDERTLLDPLLPPRNSSVPDGIIEESARALGLLGATDRTAPLVLLLTRSDSPGVALAAAGALARLGHPRGVESLRQFFSDWGDLGKLQAALQLLEYRDLSGASLLRTALLQGRLSQAQQLEITARLARADDSAAQQRLKEELTELPAGELRVQAAFALAQIGEDSGWAALRSAAMQPGPVDQQLLSLRLLARLGETDGLPQLLDLATDRKQPDSIREQALTGLGDGARFDALMPLGKVLSERGASARLRLAAAGSILQITAGERARLGEQSLRSARAALGSDSAGMRELAVAMLTEIPAEQTISPLGEALRDNEPNIRRSAARALGRKNWRAAVHTLKPALQDPDQEVRNLALQSLGQVLTVLEQRGDREAVSLVLDELHRMSTASSETDRVVASAVLRKLGMGNADTQTTLQAALTARDPQVRQLAVELGEPANQWLLRVLADPDPAVRLAGALRLAAQGLREGVSVLRTALASGDIDGLLAYRALRQLGEEAPPPQGLGSLLQSGDLQTRFHVLALVPSLPESEALRILRIALLDPISLVRRRVAELAAEQYRRTQVVSFVRIVRSLRNDTDAIVRDQAAAAAEDLDTLTRRSPPVNSGSLRQVPSPPEQAGTPIPTAPAPKGAEPIATGEILLEGEDLVRVQIDRNAPHLLSNQPIVVPSGKHRISYLGGTKDIVVLPHQTATVQIPVTLADQLLQDGKDALGRKDLPHAQENLERVRRLLQRGKVGPAQQAELAFQLGRLHEARQQLDAALTEYNEALNIPESERRPALNLALRTTVTRLSGKVGRIEIYTVVDGTCQKSRELLTPAGEQVISVGRGQTRTVFAQVGSVNKVMACQ